MWDDSISPLEEVEKVNVPLLLIHGSVDQRVPPEHAKKYRKLLDKYGKNYKYLELDRTFGVAAIPLQANFRLKRLEFTAQIDGTFRYWPCQSIP